MCNSSVKRGYMGNFDLEPNFPTNPMGSSGPLSSVKWGHLGNFDLKPIFPTNLWGHLGHFGIGSTTAITKTKIRIKYL